MKLIELSNTTPQTTAIGTPVNLGSIDRRISCGNNNVTAFQVAPTTITLALTGYYLIDLTAVVTALTADTTDTLTIYANGTELPSAKSTATLTAVGDTATHSVSKIVRVFCNSSLTISIIPSAVSTLETINVSVIKLA